MAKPNCYNRPDYRKYIQVQDGWHEVQLPVVGKVIQPRMVTIENPMSTYCMQWHSYGLAQIEKWDCDGCRHLSKAMDMARINEKHDDERLYR